MVKDTIFLSLAKRYLRIILQEYNIKAREANCGTFSKIGRNPVNSYEKIEAVEQTETALSNIKPQDNDEQNLKLLKEALNQCDQEIKRICESNKEDLGTYEEYSQKLTLFLEKTFNTLKEVGVHDRPHDDTSALSIVEYRMSDYLVENLFNPPKQTWFLEAKDLSKEKIKLAKQLITDIQTLIEQPSNETATHTMVNNSLELCMFKNKESIKNNHPLTSIDLLSKSIDVVSTFLNYIPSMNLSQETSTILSDGYFGVCIQLAKKDLQKLQKQENQRTNNNNNTQVSHKKPVKMGH